MMQHSRLEGTEILLRRFDQISDAARDQLGVELAIIGRELRDRQRAAAPEDTGALRAGLGVWLMLEQLRVRIGVIGQRNQRSRKRSYGDLFYARIVEFGRRAQTVIVQRRRRISMTLKPGQQIQILRTVRRRKVVEDIVKTYSMKVSALPARPFIFVDGAQESATQRLVNFWDQTLSRAGA